MKDGNHVSATAIHEMLSKTKTEYGLAHKVKERHLHVSGQERQRVKYVVLLLSKSCATAIQYLGERGLLICDIWRKTADFIYLVDE